MTITIIIKWKDSYLVANTTIIAIKSYLERQTEMSKIR